MKYNSNSVETTASLESQTENSNLKLTKIPDNTGLDTNIKTKSYIDNNSVENSNTNSLNISNNDIKDIECLVPLIHNSISPEISYDLKPLTKSSSNNVLTEAKSIILIQNSNDVLKYPTKNNQELLINDKLLKLIKNTSREENVLCANNQISSKKSTNSINSRKSNYHDFGIVYINKESKFGYTKQVCCVFVISCCMCILGTVIGWSAIIPKIQNDKDKQFNISNSDVRWLVSCVYLGALPGNLLGGSLGEVIGPHMFLLVLLPIAMVCWGLLTFASSLTMIYIPRICLGFIYGAVNTLVQPFVTEICETELRGLANVLPEIVVAASILFGYILANLLPWRVGTGMCGLILLPIFAMLIFVPESPYWLIRHRDIKHAQSSLLKILGPARAHHLERILKDIKTSNSNHSQKSFKDQILLLKNRMNWRPLLLVSVLIILREASGKISVFMYTVYIFKEAGVVLDPFLCTIFVGISRLTATIISAFLIDKIGRRPLLLSSVITCGVAITIAGLTLLIKQPNTVTKSIPLICVLIFCFAYSGGVGPVPWTLMGELLPTPVRSLSTSLVCICFSSSIFIMTNLFPKMEEALGLGMCFIIFGIFNFIMGITVWLFLPETSGRTLLQLETMFKGEQNIILDQNEIYSDKKRQLSGAVRN